MLKKDSLTTEGVRDKVEEAIHKELTERIIKCFYRVYNTLGYGFLERVYENAMKHELTKEGLSVESQKEIDVHYDGILVGQYFSDLLVEGLVLIELKAVEEIALQHECQLINYLKATHIEVGLLLNFGKKPMIKRRSFLNSRKSHPSSFSL